MKQIIIPIILGIFLISLISAQPILISPSTITVDVYPGETKTFNFSVMTDGGNYAVFFESSNPYITIIPNMTMVSNNMNLNLSFTFSPDIPNGTITFTTIPSIKIPQESLPSPQPSGGGGGGTTIIYKNKTIEIPNYVDREVPIEITKEVENKTRIEELEKYIRSIKTSWIITSIAMVGILVFLIHIIRAFRFERKKW